jgi:hypothetical protein
MKVFIFYIGTPTPILETELELVRRHEKSGDTVRVLQCSGNLENCHWNQMHMSFICARCCSKFRNGWKILNAGEKVEVKQFPLYKVATSDVARDFNSVDDIKRYRYDNENIGIGVASSLISIFRDHRFDTYMYRNEVIREVTTAVQVYETLKRAFEEFKPDRVYVFNGRITTHLPAIRLCKRMGIEYFTYEVGGAPNSYLLWKNSSVHSIGAAREEIDMLWSTGGAEREKRARLFFRQQRAPNIR